MREIAVFWKRGDEVRRGDLEVVDGWRNSNLDWRMSVSQGNIGASPGFFPLGVGADERKRLGIPAMEEGGGKKTVKYRVGRTC